MKRDGGGRRSRELKAAVPVALVLLVCTAPATAQTFLPRYAFHLDAEHLASDDVRFSWDADLGGEIDFLDYGIGRATFLANYEVIVGNEFRRFDANQGNYVLEGALSLRARRIELATVFHHVSRHLSDRAKRQAVDWNMLGVRAMTAGTAGRVALRGQLDARGGVERAFVDYRWEVVGALRGGYEIRPRVTLVAASDLRLVGTDGTRDRGTQTGARGEAGIRLEGAAAAVEVFVAAERRVDPYPTEFSTDTWVTAGFRLRSR
ncbi:MAG TPA: hypothetical protein VGQ10_03545 [Vicinamibacterales bacterium]|nr:hypothetical protein [Vicinamibacterales bacterium]